VRSFATSDLAALGDRLALQKRPSRPLAASVFVTKGGVLKTTLTLNMARAAALHGWKVCVVGLDMQADISTALSEDSEDLDVSLKDALARAHEQPGLYDLSQRNVSLDDVVVRTELPNLDFIPETPELVTLDQTLISRNRREHWLQDEVIEPLKRRYDLVLLDCPPNWNRLITNALVASDILISPVECRINNFRNLKVFRALVAEFKAEMRLDFAQLYVPTRWQPQRKLSHDLFQWYQSNLAPVTKTAVRETLQGEEASALRLSLLEHTPSHVAADEMRALLSEVFQAFRDRAKKITLNGEVENVGRT
jgi:chromosome partitioning protein